MNNVPFIPRNRAGRKIHDLARRHVRDDHDLRAAVHRALAERNGSIGVRTDDWTRPALDTRRRVPPPTQADPAPESETRMSSIDGKQVDVPIPLEPRRRTRELLKIAAAIVIFALVSVVLVLLLRDNDDEPTVAAPGTSTTLSSPSADATATIDPTRAAAHTSLTATAAVESGIATATAGTFATANASLPSPGEVVATISDVEGPAALVTLDDSIWVAELFGQSVVRIDVATHAVIATVDVDRGDMPWIVTYDGQIWVATSGDEIVRIDPATNQVAQTIPFEFASADEQGGLWVDETGVWASDYVTGRVANFDPSSGELLGELTLKNPDFITSAFGSLWVVANDYKSIVRIDPTSYEVVSDIAVDSVFILESTSDAVWASGGRRSSSIKRIDPASNTVVETIDTGVPRADFICVTSSGIWVSSYFQDGITMVDLTTKKPGRIIDIEHGNGGAMIEVDGSIWAARFVHNTIVRIEPTQ